MATIQNLTLSLILLFFWRPVVGNSGAGNCLTQLRAVYMAQVGVREATGRNDGPQVATYLRAVGLGPGYQWCSAFCVWCFRQARIPVPRFGRARSWFDSRHLLYRADQPTAPPRLGQGRLRCRNEPAQPPRAGDLVGYRFNGSATINHVGFLDSNWGTTASVVTVEGNTNLAGSRAGNGVWRNIRHKRMIYALARWTP